MFKLCGTDETTFPPLKQYWHIPFFLHNMPLSVLRIELKESSSESFYSGFGFCCWLFKILHPRYHPSTIHLNLFLYEIEKLRVFFIFHHWKWVHHFIFISLPLENYTFALLFMLISICLWLNGKSDRNQFNMVLVVGGGGGGIYINIIS